MTDLTVNKSVYRPDIDGMRALAVLGVVIYHAGVPGLTGGFTGVDVFFVISGFLITGILLDELQSSGTVSISSFYARRARRILPALLLVVFSAMLAGAFLLYTADDQILLFESAVSAGLFVANEYFRLYSGGYFDGPAEWMPLLHLWSLSVEEQFYLLWPVLLLLVARHVLPARRAVWLSCLCLLLILVSFGISNYLVVADRQFAFYTIASRAWELAVGAACAIAIRRGLALSPGLSVCLAASGLMMIVTGFFWLDKMSYFPGAGALLPVFGSAFLILGNAGTEANRVGQLLSRPFFVRIGLLSYSWYLWHWPLLAFARAHRLGAPDLQQDILLCLLALLLAALTLRWVENPLRHARGMLSAAVLRRASVALVLLACSGLLLSSYLKSSPVGATYAASKRIKNDKSPYRDDCHLPNGAFDGQLPLARCTLGQGKTPAVLLWGDSHAAAWAPMVEQAVAPHHGAFITLSMSSCPPVPGAVPKMADGKQLVHCRDFNARMQALARERAQQGLRGVILAARWPKYTGVKKLTLKDPLRDYLDAADRNTADSLATLRRHLASNLDQLTGAGLKVMLMLTPPEFPYEIHRCIAIKPAAQCGVSRQRYEQYRAAVSAVIREVAAGRADVRVIDPAGYFCTATECPAFVGSNPASYDDDHASASAARAYAKVLSADFDWLLQP